MILKDKTVYILWVYFFPQNTHFELNENIHHICIIDVTVVYITLGKSDTKGKIYKAEAALGRFGLQPVTSSNEQPSSNEQSSVPWLLSKDDIQLAVRRLMHIKIPAHIDCNPQYLFSHPSRLKSHDWKQVI